MKKLKTFLSFVVIFSAFLVTACPKVDKESAEKFQSASGDLSRYARQGSNIAYGLWEANIISLEVKNKIFDGFIYLNEGGVAFDKYVKKILAENGDQLPKPVIDQIKAILRSDVIDRFLDVLDKLKVIRISDSMRRTIAAIKTAVLIFADALDIKSAVKAQIETKEKLLI